jgi:hypothetical protein
MTNHKLDTIAEIAGTAFGALAANLAFVAFKAWLLVLVLGWLGITVLGFWKAVVVILLLELIFNTPKRAKK